MPRTPASTRAVRKLAASHQTGGRRLRGGAAQRRLAVVEAYPYRDAAAGRRKVREIVSAS